MASARFYHLKLEMAFIQITDPIIKLSEVPNLLVGL